VLSAITTPFGSATPCKRAARFGDLLRADIVEAIESLPLQSCFVDGEAIVVDHNGLSVFDLLRYRQHDRAAMLCAFDLIELDGKDMRKQPIEECKHALSNLPYRERDGIVFNTHYDGGGSIVFGQACVLGCEGIVSKRRGSPYRSGRTDHWLKIKNPAAPAVKREAEEDWGGRRRGPASGKVRS
jgi:bifunctional non-homologous end joining protein LigD